MRAIRISDVVAKVGLGRSTIYALGKQGLFPLPVKLSANASAWIEEQVEEWLAEKASSPGKPVSVPMLTAAGKGNISSPVGLSSRGRTLKRARKQ